MIDRSKLAGYLDEAGDDPVAATQSLLSNGITATCLRQLWTGNVVDVSDQAVRKAKTMLADANIKIIMLATDLGNVAPSDLPGVPRTQIDRALHLASFFNAPFVRFKVGKAGPETPVDADISSWMSDIQNKSIAANVVPLLELSWDQSLYEPVDAAKWLSAFPRWKLLYDPAQLVVRRRLDPFVKYWTLLKGKTAAIDLHDIKIGQSFRPPGQGDCMLQRTIKDAQQSNYNGWYFLEPGLGRRYGPALTRQDTFAQALHALNILEDQ